MANIQYIGARYVPKFYENPDDGSNDWKSGVSYEPLTVVTYLDDSYTSKIAVPASVGDPAANTNYWVKTGNYNAAITALQSNVQQNANDISTINRTTNVSNYFKGKKIVVYGDSIASTSYNWPSVLSGTFGLDITNRAIGGDFLTRPDIAGHTAGINRLIAANDLNDFDICFIAYGTNDWQISRNSTLYGETVKEAIKLFDGLSCEPIFIFPPFGYKEWTINGDTCNYNHEGQSIQAFCDKGIDACEEFHIKYVNLFNMFPAYEDNWQAYLRNETPILHPTQLGGQIIARIIANACFNTGKCFNGVYEFADKVWETRRLPEYTVGLPNLSGHHIVNDAMSSFGATTAKFKTNRQHRYKISGVVHTDGTGVVKISPNFIGASYSSPHYRDFYAHDGDEICAYGTCDGTEFNLRIFTTTGATYAYIENLSVQFDEELEPVPIKIDFASIGKAHVTGQDIYASAYDDALHVQTLDFTIDTNISGATKIATMPNCQDKFEFTAFHNNSPITMLFTNSDIYILGTFNSGDRIKCKIPAIMHKTFKSPDA